MGGNGLQHTAGRPHPAQSMKSVNYKDGEKKEMQANALASFQAEGNQDGSLPAGLC